MKPDSLLKNLLCTKALEFARNAHQGQQRKSFDHASYITHPIAVAERLTDWVTDPEIIAAAYLHDVVEDTSASIAELRSQFGDRVANLVLELTSDEDLKQKLGKAKYLIEKINHMTPDARLIKFVDREQNVKDLLQTSPEFQRRYAQETDEILNGLKFIPSAIEQVLIASIRTKIQPFLISQ